MYLCLHRVLDRGQAAHPQFAVSPHENCRPFDKCVQVVFLFFAETQRAGLQSRTAESVLTRPGP